MSLKIFTTDSCLNDSLAGSWMIQSVIDQGSESHYTSYPGQVSRLVCYENSSLKIVHKTVAEIFGERVIRPLLDQTFYVSGKVFSFLQKGFSSIGCIPMAEATEIQLVESEEQKALTKIELENEMVRNIYFDVFESLSAIEAAQITKNGTLLENYRNVTRMISDLNWYILNQKKEYGSLKKSFILPHCLTFESAQKKFSQISEQSPLFSLSEKRSLVLRFPKYSVAENIIFQTWSFKDLESRLEEVLSAQEMSECEHDSDEQESLKRLERDVVRSLTFFNPRSITLDQFKEFLSKEAVDSVKTEVTKIRKKVSDELNSIEDLAVIVLHKKIENNRHDILNAIQKICQKHKEVSKERGFQVTSDKDCHNWTIKRFFWQRELFSFSIQDAPQTSNPSSSSSDSHYQVIIAAMSVLFTGLLIGQSRKISAQKLLCERIVREYRNLFEWSGEIINAYKNTQRYNIDELKQFNTVLTDHKQFIDDLPFNPDEVL